MNFKELIASGQVKLTYFTAADQCLAFLKESKVPVALVLSDINMPKMGGMQLLDEIKKTKPEVIVYMVSAYETESH